MNVAGSLIHLFPLLLLQSVLSFAAVNSEAVVIYTANRQGEVGPCGCQTHPIGGLDRFALLVEAERRKKDAGPLLILDSGDTFFSNEQLLESRKELEGSRADLIARSYSKLGVDALVPGERDLALGLDHLRGLETRSKAKFVATNLYDKDKKSLFSKTLVIKKGEVVFGVMGLIDPALIRKDTGFHASEPAEAFREALRELAPSKPQVLIVLSHLGLEQDRKIASLQKGVLIFGAHSMDSLSKPVQIDKSAIFQPANEGQQIGVLRWNVEKQEIIEHRLVDLDDSLKGQTEVGEWVDAYKQKRKEAEIRSAQKVVRKKAASAAFVAHPESCRVCHEPQYEFWKKTKHSSAIVVLYAKNQHFDPECIGCHSLGFKNEKGFQKITRPIEIEGDADKSPFVETILKKVFAGDSLPLSSRGDPARFARIKASYHREMDNLEKTQRVLKNYLGVQCEHCHGNRNGHPVKKVALSAISESTCKQCHRPPNAPDFDIKMLPQVSCPKMER